MKARPQAWLLQALNDLALARLATDNGFHATSPPRLLKRFSKAPCWSSARSLPTPMY